ncbi:MAG: hypothetical protein HYW78_04400 [Parcubacteria group bacterium]|nr:hypothetical protein [Parcubacteria group bacterium]
MKWYVMPCDHATREQLVSEGCVIADVNGQQDLIAFPESEARRIFGICSIDSFTEEQLDQPNVFLIKIGGPSRPVRKNEVFIQSHEASAQLRPLLEDYANKYRTSINLLVPHGNPDALRSGSTLNIFIWSLPKGAGPLQKMRYTTVFGYDLPDGARDGLEPTDDGIPITDDDDQIVAQVWLKNIFILFDLTHIAGAHLLPIARAILDKAIPIALNASSSRESGKAKKQKKDNKQLYIELCKKRIVSEVDSMRDALEKVKMDREIVSKRFIDLIRIEEELSLRLGPASGILVEYEKRFADEYEKLLTVPHIRTVDIKNGVLIAYTDTITIEYDGKIYTIGEFRIEIKLNGSIKIDNLTNKRDGYNHPHVSGEGNPCLGNIAESIAKLIARYEFSFAMQLLVQYLETYNNGSPVHQISYWK